MKPNQSRNNSNEEILHTPQISSSGTSLSVLYPGPLFLCVRFYNSVQGTILVFIASSIECVCDGGLETYLPTERSGRFKKMIFFFIRKGTILVFIGPLIECVCDGVLEIYLPTEQRARFWKKMVFFIRKESTHREMIFNYKQYITRSLFVARHTTYTCISWDFLRTKF